MTTKKQTIKQKYEPKRRRIEGYGRRGMTAKQIADNLNVDVIELRRALKALDISLIYLRNYKHY